MRRFLHSSIVSFLLCIASSVAAEDAKALIGNLSGGLVVHVGCGDGKLTASLRLSKSYLVHGLDTNTAKLAAARKWIRSKGIYGPVSVDQFDGKKLPYSPNLVNLLISENLGDVPMSEVMRVLAPNGAACIKQGGKWKRTIKPRPKTIDDWTHYLHDARGTCLSQDTVVGPPRHYQWLGSPTWLRHHDKMASLTSMVSAAGRLFYIFDEGSTASILLPSHWKLIARDAFNGTILWKVPIPKWYNHLYGLKSGPIQLVRRLVADQKNVYVTLGISAPVSCVDGATGRKLKTYDGTAGTEEIILSNGVLFLITNPKPTMAPPQPVLDERNNFRKFVMAVNASTGKVLWRNSFNVLPYSLAVDDKRVAFHNGQKVVCLNRNTGKTMWTSEALERAPKITSYGGPRLILQDGVVVFAGSKVSGVTKSGGGATQADPMAALDGNTGKTLWKGMHPPSGYSSPEDLFVIDGKVWSGATSNGRLDGTFTGKDLRTGKEAVRFKETVKTYWFHHRCYPGKATVNYIMPSRTGIEFISPHKKTWEIHDWIRGGCIYGILPANGLIYTPPNACACYLDSKMFGLNAVAAADPQRVPPVDDVGRLTKGPAYKDSISGAAKPGDWPTYRGNNRRNGNTTAAVKGAGSLAVAWNTKLPGKLTSMTVADGKAYLASIDTHTLYALNTSDGKPVWDFVAGGRVDSPPTYWQGRVIFGSADGYVYCLRADTGKLIWRFRAAPIDRRMTAYEQVESVWPVSGSVLIRDGIVHCIAGRNMYLDGGLHYLKIDARTGNKVKEHILDSRDPATGENAQRYVKWLNMAPSLPDILSCDDKHVFMRSQAFDMNGKRLNMEVAGPKPIDVACDQDKNFAHLFSPTGFLDGTYFHRSYWLYGKRFASGWCGYYVAGKFVPSGKILVYDENCVYGFGRKPQYFRWTTPMEFQLFSSVKTPGKPDPRPAPQTKGGKKGKKKKKGRKQLKHHVNYHWTSNAPLLARAMVKAGNVLFVAGPPDLLDESKAGRGKTLPPAMIKAAKEQEAAFTGKRGGILLAVSVADGRRMAQLKLDSPPTWDSLIAAHGRLFYTTVDGNVVCLAGK